MSIVSATRCALVVALLGTVAPALALPDPEKFIREKGHTAKKVAPDGMTYFIASRQPPPSEIRARLFELRALLPEWHKACESFAPIIGARLDRDQGGGTATTLYDSGRDGETIACAFKFVKGETKYVTLLMIKGGEKEIYLLSNTGYFPDGLE